MGVALQEKCMSWVSFGRINESGWRQAHTSIFTYTTWLLPLKASQVAGTKFLHHLAPWCLPVCQAPSQAQPTGSSPPVISLEQEQHRSRNCLALGLPEVHREGTMLNPGVLPWRATWQQEEPLLWQTFPIPPQGICRCSCSLWWAVTSSCLVWSCWALLLTLL